MEISDVKPGDAEVYHGQIVTVSAIVNGVDEGDPVTLLYNTADGQTVDRAVPMSVDSGGLRYQCTLPPADDSGPDRGDRRPAAGRDLSHRRGRRRDAALQANGRRRADDHRRAAGVSVSGRTRRSRRKRSRSRAISRASRGRSVTIHAVANQPIKSAWLEFDPGAKDAAPEVVQLAADGARAWGTIVLQLKSDRKTPWHATYQVRFYNERGQRSQQPIVCTRSRSFATCRRKCRFCSRSGCGWKCPRMASS